ncbi:sensor histidine kinase [Actinoplanes sp. NPDC000266]
MDRARAAVDALERLVGGLGTAILAIGALIWVAAVAVTSVIGVGLPFVHSAARAVRAAADRERARLSRWGPEIIEPDPLPPGLRAARDPVVWRELAWVAVHSTWGMVLGILGISLPLYAVQDLTFPLWWTLVPAGTGPGIVFWYVDGLFGALLVCLYGVFWLAVCVFGHPILARVQAWPGRTLLAPPAGADLSLRVAQLTATRAAALDAHAAELRRIERSLHDGAQNRLVAVTVLLGAARRQVARDPDGAGELLERAQGAAEQALAELRTVVKTILPPVLDGRGLDGALKALTADSGVPCKLEVDLPGRCAASVEATAYFVVAEALTNITRHSRATSATVSVSLAERNLRIRVEDDGRGGADEANGSGIKGIRRRVEAYDGRLTMESPPGGPTTMWVELPCGS